jgi:hypothetical protein
MGEPLQVTTRVAAGAEALLRGAEDSKVLRELHEDLRDEAGPTFIEVVGKANGTLVAKVGEGTLFVWEDGFTLFPCRWGV